MIRPALALLLCLNLPGALAQTLVERAAQDQTINVEPDDPAMNKAFARARATLDGFLLDALAPVPRNTYHAVKVRITDGENTEYFWVDQLQRAGAGFRGRLDNEPRLVKTVRLGQQIDFPRSQIVDWTYRDAHGQMKGNFSTCVLLSKEKPEEARELVAQLLLKCD